MTNDKEHNPFSRRDFLKLCGLFPLAGLAPNLETKPTESSGITRIGPTKLNILILVLDTLTAHQMSLYGYQRETTPNITRLAERATVYHNHQAAGNYTAPATASMLTGAYPWSHRGLHSSAALREEFAHRNIFALLPKDYYTLAYTHNSLAMSLLYRMKDDITELLPFDVLALQENTAAGKWFWNDLFLAGWGETIIRGVGHPPSSLFLSILDPLRQRIRPEWVKKYGDLFPLGIPSANFHNRYFLLEDAMDWLITNLGELPQPYLVYFHLMPPHEPYTPRVEFIDRFLDGEMFPQKPVHFFSDNIPEEKLQTLRREYDEYLAYADAEVGRLFEVLSQSGQLENTYFILTSDHGQLFERGIHGHITPTLYAPLLHVPLLIACPGQAKREDIHSLTSGVDLMPTLLNIAGVSAPSWAEGSVLPGFEGAAKTERSVFALEAKDSALQGLLRQATLAMVQDQYKLVHYYGYPGFDNEYELYDLRADPEEMVNLYEQSPDLAKEMCADMQPYLEKCKSK